MSGGFTSVGFPIGSVIFQLFKSIFGTFTNLVFEILRDSVRMLVEKNKQNTNANTQPKFDLIYLYYTKLLYCKVI